MLYPLKIPVGVAKLFSVNSCLEISIPEQFAYRPDKVLDYVGQKSFKRELINNSISNVSPISLSKGKSYLIADELFVGYFGAM